MFSSDRVTGFCPWFRTTTVNAGRALPFKIWLFGFIINAATEMVATVMMISRMETTIILDLGDDWRVFSSFLVGC
jgi:hypothetical protein